MLYLVKEGGGACLPTSGVIILTVCCLLRVSRGTCSSWAVFGVRFCVATLLATSRAFSRFPDGTPEKKRNARFVSRVIFSRGSCLQRCMKMSSPGVLNVGCRYCVDGSDLFC